MHFIDINLALTQGLKGTMSTNHQVVVFLICTLIISNVPKADALLTPGQELYEKLEVAGRNETTFFKEVQVHQYNDYGSLEVFQFTVPPGSSSLKWLMIGAENSIKCPARKIISHLQYGSYPLFTPDGQNPNKTYPDGFYTHREYQYNMSVMSNVRRSKTIKVTYPLPGDWFLASYVSENVDQVIKKITSSKCRYGLGVLASATVPVVKISEDLVFGKNFTVFFRAEERSKLFRYFIGDNTWRYRVVVGDCSEGGSDIKCPFHVLSRGGSYPSPGQAGTHRVHCKNSTAKVCTLAVHGPLLNHWHYLVIYQDLPKNITFKLQIQNSECLPVVLDKVEASKQGPNKPRDSDKENTNDTTLKFHPAHSSQHSSESETETNNSHEAENKNNGTKDTKFGNNTNLPQSRGMSAPPNLRNTSGDGNVTSPRLIYNGCLALVPPDSCRQIFQLQRLESANSEDFTTYTVNGRSGEEILTLCDRQPAVVRFDVLPVKDIGGTLVFSAKMKYMDNSTDQNTTVEVCIQQDSLPLNGSQMMCSDQAARFNLSTFAADGDLSADLYFPYPQSGMWFVVMRPKCFSNDSSDIHACFFPEVVVVMEIVVAPCVASGCGRYGSCHYHNKGAFALTACSCVAGYQGYGCTDGSNATSDGVQLTYTLILTLSNLFFCPAIVLATYRRYYVEAIVYSANMFFSSIYHACDVAGMSIFRKCIMPYGVLQYCDFFCSIMSFWVTLLAVAKIPAQLRSVGHMIGVIGLAMGVQWQEHGLWTNVVPISAGAAIVIASWVVQCYRGRKCYPRKRQALCLVPGFLLAATGLCLFAFIETDKNYPYTHSGWHICMSVCIIFLLPKRKLNIKDETTSETSEYELGGADTVSLVPADSLAINTADGDDINL